MFGISVIKELRVKQQLKENIQGAKPNQLILYLGGSGRY